MSWGETLFLKKTIDGKKRFVANNDVLLVASNKNFVFKTEADGALRLKVNAKSTESAPVSFSLEISSDKGFFKTFTQTTPLGGGVYDFDIEVARNSTYTVTISRTGISGGKLSVDYVHICGQMTDFNYLKEVL